ncbi:MAG TPA: hypothetical protein VFC68_00780, partial [Treponemataceae bacterium]|nr:hypothetical protein [Treponemataceae bacterium]
GCPCIASLSPREYVKKLCDTVQKKHANEEIGFTVSEMTPNSNEKKLRQKNLEFLLKNLHHVAYLFEKALYSKDFLTKAEIDNYSKAIKDILN